MGKGSNLTEDENHSSTVSDMDQSDITKSKPGMTRRLRIVIAFSVLLVLGGLWLYWFVSTRGEREHSHVVYTNHCAGCHGEELQGTPDGSNLMATKLNYGDGVPALMRSIDGDLEPHRQLDWREQLSGTTVKALALYISEHRQEFPATAASYQHSIAERNINSKYHRFRIEIFSDLASRPYSIAPLPDGRIIVSEKVRGLTVVSAAGVQGELIENAPRAHPQFASLQGTYVGWGQLLDVALHPDYPNNGWIYVSYADRCQLDCGSVVPQSMVKVVRGRIQAGNWVDQQTIWSVHNKYYTIVPDGVACGRLGFDKEEHLYISVGGKAHYKHLHNMNTPYGKVHRVKDDGSVPSDNPFWLPESAGEETSSRHTVWSFGHRTIQGIEGHPVSGEIWSSEMGPRGGDEVNEIIGGGNYGWPLYTNGLDYDSKEVSIGKDLGLDFPIEDTVLPVVDFTPAPALSNLTFHNGDRFPGWKSDLLLGSLKAMTLYRLRIEEGKLVENEKLVTGLGRIRDIEMGADGLVYIAIEHGDAGSIVRLVPVE